MEFDNEFEVPAPPDTVWAHLLDVERVVPCMPGAELTETVDDTTWKGQVTIKLGAISMSFKGTVTMSERDEDAKRVVLDAKGMEARGKGQAKATVTTSMEATPEGGTRVHMHNVVSLSGQAAQMGRGMIGDVSQRLAGEFADCIAGQLTRPAASTGIGPAPADAAGGGETEPRDAGGVASTADATAASSAAGGSASPTAPQSREIGGIRLTLWALWRAVVRGVRRLSGRAGP